MKFRQFLESFFWKSNGKSNYEEMKFWGCFIEKYF